MGTRATSNADVAAAANANPNAAQLSVDGLVALDGGTLQVATQAATLRSQGSASVLAPLSLSASASVVGGTLTVRDGGTLATPALDVTGASLALVGGGRLVQASNLSLGNAGRLDLAGDETVATLADRAGTTPDGSARVALAQHRFTVRSDATDTAFSGRIDTTPGGAGVLVKAGSGSLTLTGASQPGQVVIEAGSLRLGDGGSTGSVGDAGIVNQGLLRLSRSDTLALTGAVSGSGALLQDGGGSLLLRNPANSYSGATTVSSGTLRAGSVGGIGGHLSPNSAVGVAAAGRLVLDGDETLAAIQADGPVRLGGSVSSSGDQVYNAAVSLSTAAPITLSAPGHLIDARNDGNDWGSQPLSIQAKQLLLSAGKNNGVYRDLVLGQVVLGAAVAAQAGATAAALTPAAATDPNSADSSVDAGHLSLGRVGLAATANPQLDGLLRLFSGKLTLRAQATPTYAALDEPNAFDPQKSRPLFVAENLIQQSAASSIQSSAGSLLTLHSVLDGSIDLGQVGNRFDGGVAALSGADRGAAWSAKAVPGNDKAAGQSRINLSGASVVVGGLGLEADLVRIQAGALSTDGASTITARLWYNDEFGTAKSTPGLRLTLLDGAFGDRASFGSGQDGIATSVGAIAEGSVRLGLQAGFVQLRPKGGARGATAVFLTGPKIGASGYKFFHDGAGEQGEVPLFYNGVLPATPQLSGSLSAVASVSETARKERFEEAVRTENVAGRVRTGVIAEVGPGSSATEGSQGLKVPENCVPTKGHMDCQTTEAATPASVVERVRSGVIGEVGAGRSATEGTQAPGIRMSVACAPGDARAECKTP